MEHADWIGLSVLIGTVTSSIVSILAALQAMRNHTAIKEVEVKVNGVTDKLVSTAHENGRQEALLQQNAADVRATQRKQQ